MVEMEDIVAVAVTLDNGERRYFMTWGRIQDSVDPQPLEDLVLRHARSNALGGEPVSSQVCTTLQEASQEPYLFEALVSFASRPIPFGPKYEDWRREKAAEMEEGQDLYYLGRGE
jgi:hypothetical protein